jgi:YHS domain-containing protein
MAIGLLTVLGAFGLFGAVNEPEMTVDFDVVTYLDRGEEVAGEEKIFVDRGRIRYQFSSETNKAKFENAVSKYEVQLGGRCGRMGPLSGSGFPQLRAIHDGKLYFFASKQCRDTFLKDPEKLLEKDDRALVTTKLQAPMGEELFAKFVEWSGGASAVDALKFVEQRFEQDVVSGGQNYRNVNTVSLRLPSDMRTEDRWNESAYIQVLAAGAAFEPKKGSAVSLHDQERRAMERVRNHLVPVILRARKRPDFVAASRGPCEDDPSLERLEVFFDGSSTDLYVDPKSGRLACIEYTGRGIGSFMGRVALTFTTFESIGGVKVPSGWTVTFDGKPWTSMNRSGLKISANGKDADFEK